ncbi:MAG: hypothetical protein D6707_03110 [Bacteroidetes bacterium]|nr:MAG: hypothetical protein D6707_03110 [Bacteroidota bacterium]
MLIWMCKKVYPLVFGAFFIFFFVLLVASAFPATSYVIDAEHSSYTGEKLWQVLPGAILVGILIFLTYLKIKKLKKS